MKQIVAKAIVVGSLPAIENEAVERLVAYADGDARRLLNTLETLAVAAGSENMAVITDAWLLKVLGERLRRYDKGGEQFYDTISALHKSRARLGPRCLAVLVCAHARRRRGPALPGAPADPHGQRRHRSGRPARPAPGAGCRRGLRAPGQPEGELALAECLVYLAMAPKSNAVYKAFNEAKAFVKKDGTRPVPMHLRNAPTKLMKELDYGKGYRYAHDEDGGFAAGERYLPDGMPPPGFYRPVQRGLEIRIADKLEELRRLNNQQN